MEQSQRDLLLYDYLSGSLSWEEMQQVESWLEESEANKVYFKGFRKDFLELRWGLRAELIKGSAAQIWRRRHKRIIRRATAWTAAAMCILSIGWLCVGRLQKEEVPVEVAEIVQGRKQAQLILSSGRSITLDSHDCHLTEVNGTSIVVDTNGAVSYATQQHAGGEVLYNTMITPQGGEYTIVLGDGTQVWLNAKSELRYPVVFADNQREVYLKGEAYFEVERDDSKPFVVHAGDVCVEVLGTAFNVNNYHAGKIETVLVEGCVGMSNATSNVTLKPGQRGCAVADRREIQVEEVDVSIYTAWKDGYFVFEKQALEDVMEQLARWYNVEIFYMREAARHECLSGEMTRYKEICPLLYYFEKISDARFEIKGRTIVVK